MIQMEEQYSPKSIDLKILKNNIENTHNMSLKSQ